MADHAKTDADLATLRRKQEEEKRRREAVTRFFSDYKQLDRLADELRALALALGVPLDAGANCQTYAKQVAALLERIRAFRLDPDCDVNWPIPREVLRAMPKSARRKIVDYLTGIKARREVRDGVEVVVPGPKAEAPPAWAHVMEGLGRDTVLWRAVAKLAAQKTHRPAPVSVDAKRYACSDVHRDVAAEICCKIVFTVLCRAHVWYDCRHQYESWRGVLFRQLTESAVQRATRGAQGTTGMPRKTDGGRIVQLSDDPDATPGQPLGSSSGAEDPSEIVAREEWIRRTLAIVLGFDPEEDRVFYLRLRLDKMPSPSEIAKRLGVTERQAQRMLTDALDLLAGWSPHRPIE